MFRDRTAIGYPWAARLVVLASLLGLSGAAHAADPNLIAWWTFDEAEGRVAQDSSGHDNTGTINGDPEWVRGFLGSALDFDGSDDYVAINRSLLNNLREFTVACWINAANYTTNRTGLVGQDNCLEFGFTNNGDLTCWSSGMNGLVVFHYPYTYPSWHHVAVAGRTNGLFLYIDGQQVASSSTAFVNNFGSSTYPVNIAGGGIFDRAGNWFCGQMDDVRIYNRALSAAEIETYWKVAFVDFNGDGVVDANDLAILIESWGQADPYCDIGPFPWGDGVVDEMDLAVLMEYLMTPGPQASDVPCEMMLSWIGPSFAESYDVYFGTSLDDVSNATRDDPCGVLVSIGQTETTYDPNELLEFNRTYYWRIDTILGSFDAAICTGSVLSFTTEPFARPIKNVIARASSSASGSGPDKTVDGSGLDDHDGHSIEGKDMWLSGQAGPHWIQCEFDRVYVLHELWVWNSNLAVEPFLGFGARTVKIEYSSDGAAWTPLEGVPEFAQAPGQAGYAADTTVSFDGVSAQYVKLSIEKAWGTTPSAGLSEVRFFYIPDRSSINP